MNVTPVSSVTQRSQDFTTLQTALQTGNLAGAQTAFAALLQDVQKTSQTAGPASLFGPGTPAARDLETLGGALKSANLAGAQRAFATLQGDIQAAGGNNPPTVRAHRPFTHAEIANNGVDVPNTPALGGATAQSVGRILNLKV
ncbi:MAG: hypothetical protein ABSA83_22820 [Verrucomicrobiota bacterium]|jgi:hypothetical protein